MIYFLLTFIELSYQYPRNLTYYTDSMQDTNIIFPRFWEHTYLQPDEIFEIKVVIKPNAHSAQTKCRHIYIESAHPNITFEIPIGKLAILFLLTLIIASNLIDIVIFLFLKYVVVS